ncbi:hypothetical protein [Otariodibacter oris]|uniref:Uncharacterized protein n=1 Tax=Otariodibacter oris TaxID=1032623 RepID=A0A420XI32_9PAST|nr:hypothetical protein [Otariodibacter oris]QGM80796.1 hypothetical protein A6A10_04950 [Otariodibacter oris]RKR77034.1 hypothetical protein DES31_0353 [Otariodibacter oris]
MLDVKLPDGMTTLDVSEILDDIKTQSAQLHELETELHEFKNELEELDKSFRLNLSTYENKFNDFQNDIKTSLGNATADAANISNTLSNVRKSEEDVSKIKNEISHIASKYDEEVDKYSELISNIGKEYQKLTEQMQTEQNELIKLRKNLSDEQVKIHKILGDANRASMAQSFLERKEELDPSLKNSANWRNFGLLLMSLILCVILVYEWDIGFDYGRFLSRLPVISPLIWLVWVNSQRNAHLVRIQEEYAHKASVALAFEGYQRKVDESDDPDIKKLLLELSVANLGENPVNLFDKQVKSSPIENSVISRILEKFFPKLEK